MENVEKKLKTWKYETKWDKYHRTAILDTLLSFGGSYSPIQSSTGGVEVLQPLLFWKTLENLNATGNLSSWNPRKGLRQDCSIASTLSSTQGLQLSFESQLLCRDVKKRGVGVPPWNLWIEEPQSAMIRKIWLATQKASSLHPSAIRKTQRTTESMTRKRLWNSGSVFAPFTSSSKVKSPVPVTSWG